MRVELLTSVDLSGGMAGPGPAVSLPEVTLVAVSSVALDATVRALRASMRQVRFGRVLLLSDRLPAGMPQAKGGKAAIEWRRIAPIRSRGAYSRFMLDHLVRHIETGFALVAQWDGYVLDGSRWLDDFMEYDYIGAPWPQFSDGGTVGNGGFSLRSKRLLEACRGLPMKDGEAEDVVICRNARPTLEGSHGLRFAPESVARRFAYERTAKQGDEFGFHGVFNMVKGMCPSEFAALLATLEPSVLGRRELGEVLRGGVRNRHLPTIFHGLRHKFARSGRVG